MKIKIKYEIEYERQRVKFTLSKLKWYKDNGYNVNVPNGTIEEEFKKEDYERAAKKLMEEFNKIKKHFADKLTEKFGSEIPKEFEVILTKYGTGGSYNLPNKVIINILNKKPNIETFKHEIIHLLVEKNVQRNKLSHWEKEKLVEDILKEL